MLGHLIGVLFDGIAYGSLLFVISIGLSVTMGLMNFVNLAHGAFAMLGGYACAVLMTRAGVPFLASLPVAFAVSALAGIVLERTLYQRLYKAPHLDQVMFSIGLVFMSVAAATWLFGPSQQPVRLPDFLIRSARAEMLAIPQPECRQVLAGVNKLEGLCISAGFTKKVRALFPRVETCPHLISLIVALAPIALQGAFVQFIGAAGKTLIEGGAEAAALMEASFSWWKNTCYVAAEDGPVVRQIKERGMLYSLPEVAAILQVDYRELLAKAQKGEFPAFEQEGKWVVRWQDLEPWFKARQAERRALSWRI